LTASRGIVENGTSEDTRLYIGQYRALEDLGGIAPTAMITSPAPGATFIEGEVIPITVDATDDVAVASVSVLLDGIVTSTDTAAPYQFTTAAPTGAASVRIGARVVDLAGMAGLAGDVDVNVIPDPGTTMIGRVIQQDQTPVSGASVDCSGLTAMSAGDGTFAIPGVPTLQTATS